MKNIVRYASIYFVIVFSMGFLLGTLRVLFMVPYLGEQKAELLEMPLMVLVSFLSARFVVKAAAHTMVAVDMVLVGLLALGFLLAVELSMVLWLRDLSIPDYVASRYSLAGIAYVVSLILYAIFPYIVYKVSMLPNRQA